MAAAAFLAGPAALAQQDGTVTHPGVYRVQFENPWVRVVRVSVPARGQVSEHIHPPGLMVHVYLTDAEPLTFVHSHDQGATIVRPAVAARSYRVGRTVEERHAITNFAGGASEYLRIEFKTEGDRKPRQRVAATPVLSRTVASVEVTTPEMRITRLTVAPREQVEIATPDKEPALVIALTDGVAVDGATPLALGSEQFIAAGRKASVRPGGFSPVQLLRIDFLTPAR